jgi:dihydroorotate dehydrogenase
MKVIGSKLKRSFSKVPVGINLGANRDSKNRIEDYSKVLLECGDFVDFATLNISSPNTSKLRELQEPDNLKILLLKLEGVKKKLKKNIPIFVKISPDLKDQALGDLISVVTASNVDGIIATNTTISRRNLTSSSRNEIGGLSGKPLKDISTRMIAKISHVTNGSLPIIGVGGVSSAEDAYDKICAGASAIQLYTALVYEGFSVINKICFGLDKLLHADGHQELKTAIGSKKEKWL